MSTLEVSNLNDGTTTVGTTFITNGSAKAWINFNGNSFGTRGSFNTSSITDDGTGSYSWTFTSNMSNGNYCVTASQGGDTNNNEVRVPTNAQTFAASGFSISTLDVGVALLDSVYVCMSVNGDLA